MYRPSPWDDDYVAPVADRAVPSASSGYNRQVWDSDSDSDSNLGDDAAAEGFPELCDSDSDMDDAKPPDDLFVEEMVDLYLERTLNARHFCTLMYLIGNAGPDLQKKCKAYGRLPKGRSGHFERHCKRKLGPFMDEAGTGYSFKMLGRNKHSAGRAEHTIHASAVHEELDADLRDDPGIKLRLEEAIADNKFPPNILRSSDSQGSSR